MSQCRQQSGGRGRKRSIAVRPALASRRNEDAAEESRPEPVQSKPVYEKLSSSSSTFRNQSRDFEEREESRPRRRGADEALKARRWFERDDLDASADSFKSSPKPSNSSMRREWDSKPTFAASRGRPTWGKKKVFDDFDEDFEEEKPRAPRGRPQSDFGRDRRPDSFERPTRSFGGQDKRDGFRGRSAEERPSRFTSDSFDRPSFRDQRNSRPALFDSFEKQPSWDSFRFRPEKRDNFRGARDDGDSRRPSSFKDRRNSRPIPDFYQGQQPNDDFGSEKRDRFRDGRSEEGSRRPSRPDFQSRDQSKPFRPRDRDFKGRQQDKEEPWWQDRKAARTSAPLDPRVARDRAVLKPFLPASEGIGSNDENPRLFAHRAVVPKECNGFRTDAVLPRLIPGLTRSSARLMVLAGRVSLVGRDRPRIYHPDERLLAGDELKLLIEHGRKFKPEDPAVKEIEDFDEWKRANEMDVLEKQTETRRGWEAKDEPKVKTISTRAATEVPIDEKKLKRQLEREAEIHKAHFELVVDDIRKNRIIKRTPSFLFIDKPENVSTQPGSAKTALVLSKMLPHLAEEGEELRLVSRLDRDTTGVMAIARTKEAARLLADKLAAPSDPDEETPGVKKEYIALLGRPLDGSIAEEGTVNNHIAPFGPPGNEIMKMYDEPVEGSKPCTTSYKILAWFKNGALVQMSPITGRKHQLRAFAAQVLNSPVIGDWKYGVRPKTKSFGARMCLHCIRLTIDEEVATAGVPDWGEKCEERNIAWEDVLPRIEAFLDEKPKEGLKD